MTKILVLSSMYPPHHYGGYELSCRDVVDHWRKRGHEVTVLTSTMRAQNAVDDPAELDARILRKLTIFFEDGALVRPPLWRQVGIERTNQQILADTLEAVQPDVVSIWAMGAMSTGLLTPLVRSGIPLVFSVCDDWPTYAYKIDPWMNKWYRRPRLGRMVERLMGVPSTLPDLGRAGTFCFISENNRLRCEQYSPWSFADATVVYNGIDLGAFPILDHEPDRSWRWKLVTAGRLDPRKGLETAIRALALLPSEAELEVLPSVDDPYRAHLEEVAAEVGVSERVQYRNVTRTELRDRYEDADVCLFPTEWDEPFGLVPIEAMARGTPVVATGSGGSGEFLIDGMNCVRCSPGDPQSLADAVSRLEADPSLRRRIAKGGLATASELNVDRLAEVLELWHIAAADHFVNHRPPHRKLQVH
ncbi:MAG TPA: glycosyltransferase family 4 protein [Acidimicrobiales bacterium]